MHMDATARHCTYLPGTPCSRYPRRNGIPVKQSASAQTLLDVIPTSLGIPVCHAVSRASFKKPAGYSPVLRG